MFITKKHLPRRTFLTRHGRDARAAAARRDGAGAHAAREDGGQARRRASDSSTCRTAPSWTSGRRRTEGAGFEFTPILKPLEPFREYVDIVSGLGHRAADTSAVHSLSPTTWLSGVRPKPTQGVDAFAGITADQIAAHEDRPGHAAPVDRNRDRRSVGPHRLVRPRLRLHLHEHAVVADADDADADGDQPAQGVRADVRPGRQPGRAAGAHGRGPQHPRRGHAADQAICSAASAARTR